VALRDSWWPRRGERLIPAVSAVLLALSFPPLHSLVPPFVGLAPFALWVHSLDGDAAGRHSAMRGSMVFGAVYFGVLFYWILIALIWFTKLAILAYAGTIGVLIIMSAMFGWTLHHALRTLRMPLWLALPITWTALEWSRAHLPSTLAFPWLGLGSSLTGFPELVGVAEIVGSRGVTFWLALVNGLVAGLVLDMRAGVAWGRRAAAIAAVVALPIAWGVWRAQTLETREVGRVTVVQPNIPEHIKLDGQAGVDSTFASLERLMPRVEPGSVDLVVMPEVTVRAYAEASSAAALLARVQSYAREVGAPIVFGSLGHDITGPGARDYVPYNSAFVMEPQGLTDYRYDKRYLVPFVERVPIVPPEWLGGLRYFGGYGVGRGWPLVETGGAAYGVLICYESSYPEGSRSFRLAGADVLLNITNDAWYGREPLYARTTALWQHPAHMVMRAIENRMGVARAANTGISLYVDPVGRVYNATDLFEADIRTDVVRTSDVVTFFTRFGDLVGNGAAIAAVLIVLAAVRRERVGARGE
jgi:apolipoprotein N-acyltransferase